MGFFEYIKLRWFCSEELAEMILEYRSKKEKETGRLHYCKKHRQESHQIDYPEHNCEMCRLGKINGRLTEQVQLLEDKSS